MAKKSGSFGAGSLQNGVLALDRLRGGEAASTADAERTRKCGEASRNSRVGGGEGAISGSSPVAPTRIEETRGRRLWEAEK